MLILSRRTDQRIKIGDDIEIVVLGIDREHVKLGIAAPRHVPVVRTELLAELRKENVRAVQAGRAVSPATLVPTLRRIGLQQRAASTPAQVRRGDQPAAPPKKVSSPSASVRRRRRIPKQPVQS